MPDLGSDMGNTSVTAASRMISAAVSLIQKIFEMWERRTRADYKLSKAKLKEQEAEVKRKAFAEKIEGKAGYVRHRELQKAGVPLTATSVNCTKEEFRQIASACKRNGIIITAQDDVRKRELGGKKQFVVMCRQSDLPRFAELVDALNDAKRIENLKAEKDTLLALGDAMTEEDRLVVKGIDEEILAIREGNSELLNARQRKGAIDRAITGKTYNSVSFDDAVDRWTGGHIDKDTTCYIVDARDPDRYVIAHARQDNYQGEDYIKTTYEVYNGDTQVFATNDGRFEGRTPGFWQEQKQLMQENGGIGDTVIKFYDKAEMEAYRKEFKAQEVEELDILHPGEKGRDYEQIQQSLESKMAECGAAYKDGIAVSAETGEPLKIVDSMSAMEQANVAEATVCAEQITNYKEMSRLEEEISVAKANILTTTEETPEHAKAVVNLENLNTQYEKAVKKELALIEKRKDVNFVQSEQTMDEGGQSREAAKDKNSRSAEAKKEFQKKTSKKVSAKVKEKRKEKQKEPAEKIKEKVKSKADASRIGGGGLVPKGVKAGAKVVKAVLVEPHKSKVQER